MRNRLLLFFASLLLSHAALAECTASGITVWPLKKTIARNPVFIVEGFANSQAVIEQLGKEKKVYLKSGDAVVQLKVVRVLKGGFYLTQAVLKPVSELVPGLAYELHIDGEVLYGRVFPDGFKWTVSDLEDREVPEWQKPPVYVSKSMTRYGCGPGKKVNFCFCSADPSPVVVLTKLKELKTGEVTEYYLTPEVQSLSIGHGMCSGAFEFLDGEQYEVQFSLMDASGNSSKKPTDAVTFTSPTDDDPSIDEAQKDSCNCEPVAVPVEKKENELLIIALSCGFLLLVAGILFFMRKRRVLLLLPFAAFVSCYGQNGAAEPSDTVFLKYNAAETDEALNYRTDTLLFESPMWRHVLTGTTILPWTHNQLISKGYGLDFRKVDRSDCQHDAQGGKEGMDDHINSVTQTDSTLVIDFNLTDNCCYDFLCDISVDEAGTLNLIYTGYGTYCACDCCFGLTYYIDLLNYEDSVEVKAVMINGDVKTRKVL